MNRAATGVDSTTACAGCLRGIYNVPTYLVDGQQFTGRQHLPMIRWLTGSEGRGPL